MPICDSVSGIDFSGNSANGTLGSGEQKQTGQGAKRKRKLTLAGS